MAAAEYDRTRIDVVKGILILAVIVGHNEAIAYNAPWLRQLLYYFHVQCFFLLSSFLDTKPFDLWWLRDRAVRYVMPYAWFLGLCSIAYVALRPEAGNVAAAALACGRALAISNGPTIYAATGMRYLWFMPALLSFAIIKAAAIRWPAWGRVLTIGAWLWMVVEAIVMPRLSGSLPWGLGSALFFFGLGQAATYAVRRLSLQATRRSGVVAACLAVAMSVIIVFVPLGRVAAAGLDSYDIRHPATWLMGICYPCVMLTVLYSVAGPGGLASGRFLGRLFADLGRWSFPVYLLHVPVYRALTRTWFGRGFDDLQVVGPHLGAGFAIFVLTMGLSLGLSAVIWSVPWARRAIFPRSWQDWCSWRSPDQTEHGK